MTALTLTSAFGPPRGVAALPHLLWSKLVGNCRRRGPLSTQLSPTPFLWLWVSLWEDLVGPKLRVPPPSSQGMGVPQQNGPMEAQPWAVGCSLWPKVSGGVVPVGL